MRDNIGAIPAATIGIFAILVALLVFAGQSREIDSCVIGDITSRNQAGIPAPLAHTYLDAQRMQFGVGAVAIGDWRSLGDGLVAGGQAWLRTTYHDSPNYYSLVVNRYFQSNFLVYVPPEIRPAETLRVGAGTRAQELWKTLAQRYPEGVVLEGYAHMRLLHTIAIAQPAIDRKPISGDTPYYYTQPMASTQDTWIYAVGYVYDATALPEPRTGAPAMRAPDAGGPSVSSGLTHALALSHEPEDRTRGPARGQASSVGQLIGDSVFLNGEFRLYPMRRPTACATAEVRN